MEEDSLVLDAEAIRRQREVLRARAGERTQVFDHGAAGASDQGMAAAGAGD